MSTVSAFVDPNAEKDEEGETYYTYEELLKRPQGIDTAKTHLYLRAEEFLKVFGMTKKNFNSLPAWKQKNLRVQHKLF